MEEEYILQETAQLAKEKGFNEPCDHYYMKGELYNVLPNLDYRPKVLRNSDLNLYKGAISASTQSFLAKWLREVHNMFIEVSIRTYTARYDNGKVKVYATYYYKIINIINGEKILKSSNVKDDSLEYEKTLEAGLVEALKRI